MGGRVGANGADSVANVCMHSQELRSKECRRKGTVFLFGVCDQRYRLTK
jgi:hypothetical protein